MIRQFVITNSDPGVRGQGDSVETTLDTEWSGAVAPGATVKVIIAASTNSADGIDLSALYAVNHNVAPIVSLSYGSCEAGMGSSELAYYNSLWQQAAAQGQSVFVSSGDSGAAGCNGGSDSTGYGQGVNGLCSSPYATCVGGTEFAEGSNPAQYWQPGNSSVQGSAISYIPETVWNESASDGGSGLWAGGGGASIAYSKPSWQAGTGVPADGKRDVPDISMAAAGHDGYLIQLYGGLNSVGGTSAAAPSFAGIMALVDQKAGAAQGLANLVLYPLGVNQSSGGAAVFHDITTGNNSVPGVTGFAATKGYDLGSGLGSVDANLLVNHWSDVAKGAPATLALSASASTLTVAAGKTVPTTITSTASATLKSAVALTVAGIPTGITATFSSATIASPGSGASTLNVTAASTVTPGTYPITITGQGGSQTAKVSISVVVPTPTFTLTPSATAVTATVGKTSQVGITSALVNGFSSAVMFTVSGAPTGLTATLAPATIAAPGSGSVVLNITPGSTVTGGNYTLTVTAQGGGQTVKQTIAVAIPTPAFTMTASTASVTTLVGKTAAIKFTTAVLNGFSSAVAFTSRRTPAGLNGCVLAFDCCGSWRR